MEAGVIDGVMGQGHGCRTKRPGGEGSGRKLETLTRKQMGRNTQTRRPLATPWPTPLDTMTAPAHPSPESVDGLTLL
jgi:hypothetical protein